ncbi:hypothetical protein A2U01_0097367 [Trifolium medium]|nr:hypothetical protein [Trifolium medium]
MSRNNISSGTFFVVVGGSNRTLYLGNRFMLKVLLW